MPVGGLGCAPPVLQDSPRRRWRRRRAAVKSAEADGLQVIPFSVLGHKADLGFMAIGPDWMRLRRLQAGLQVAGLEVVSSYVSLTELSEYATGLPEQHLRARLHPRLPPETRRLGRKRRVTGDSAGRRDEKQGQGPSSPLYPPTLAYRDLTDPVSTFILGHRCYFEKPVFASHATFNGLSSNPTTDFCLAHRFG